jgi:hypothetical protein
MASSARLGLINDQTHLGQGGLLPSRRRSGTAQRLPAVRFYKVEIVRVSRDCAILMILPLD